MRALIDALEEKLSNHPALAGKHVEAYGSTEVIPDRIPYINIIPRSKERDRQFYIGSDNKHYHVQPQVEFHVWETSLKDLRDAFDRCESLSEDLLDILADTTASELGIDYHQSMIEAYDDARYDMSFYYVAVIVLKAQKDETH